MTGGGEEEEEEELTMHGVGTTRYVEHQKEREERGRGEGEEGVGIKLRHHVQSLPFFWGGYSTHVRRTYHTLGGGGGGG